MTVKGSVPNIVTSLRFPAAAALVLLPQGTAAFWCVYAFCGLTDILDGFLARRLCAVSSFGSRLDSWADMAFAAACAAAILPRLVLPQWLWGWTVGIAMIRLAVWGVTRCGDGQTAFRHSGANRLTGFAIFLALPFLAGQRGNTIAVGLCALASWSTGQELLRSCQNYGPDS